jgi:ketosteroid isomerase-like protein
MSQENVEIVRKVFDAMAAGDREQGLAYADPSIVVDATRRVFNPKTYRGLEGLEQLSADVDEVWEDFVSEPDEYLDAGDQVVVSGRVTGKGRGSGVVVRDEFSSVWTVRDGRIVHWELHTDRASALESVGLARDARSAKP